MHETSDAMLRDEIKRASEQIGPITIAEVLARPLFDAEAGADEVHGDRAVFDLRQRDERGRPDDGAVRGSPRRRRMITVTVAAAIVLVAGVVSIDGGKQGVVVTDATSSPGVTESAAVDAVPADGLSKVPQDETVFDGADCGSPRCGSPAISSVIAAGPGWVAVGETDSNWSLSDPGDGDAAVWSSVDGITWSRVPHDEAVFGGEGSQSMGSVIVGGPGLVAVGSDTVRNDTRENDEDAAVWTSVDGITWSRVPHDEAVFGGAGDQWIEAVTLGGPGLVAVGFDRRGAWGSDGVGSAVVWTSVDGATWSRVPHDEAVLGAASMQDVVVGGPGLVAVGHDRGLWTWDNSTGQAPVVWTSVDGLTWSRVPDQAAFDGANVTMLGVTAGGLGLVAVGFDGATVAPVWTSVDGVSWSRIADDDAFANGTMVSVTAGGPGLVAVGFQGWTVLRAAIWTSVDGIAWSGVPYDETVFGPKGDGRINYVTATDSGLVAIGSNSGVEGIWTSADGITWSAVEPVAEISTTESPSDAPD